MKKTRILTVMLCITAGLGLLSFAACKPDEEKPTATLTLSAGEGGTLTQTTYEVEVGASVAEYLKSVTVTPEEGFTFAGWYNGSTPVSTETMPESGLSLTAKYSVPCTLALYLADVNGAYGEATTTQETAIYGEAFTYSPSVPPHFTLDTEKENKLTSQKLGKGETFTAYLKRDTYGVHYYVNAPAGAEEEFGGEISPASVVYGAELDLPSASALTSPEWFRFAGWATEANGEVSYQAGEKVSPESDLFLYAVWDRAYEDRFGGGDFVFFPQAEEGVAILRRAGQEHRGTRDGNNFSFKNGDEEVVKGQVNASGTFMYYREGLEEETYRHFNIYQGVFHTDEATIEFDGYGNGTYTVGETVKHGVISYKPSPMFYTFEGDGEHFDFILTDVSGSDGSSETVFIMVGEEIGSYLAFQFHYEETEIKADVTSVGLMLSGLGYMEFFNIETDDTLYQGVYESNGNNVVTLSWVDEENVSNVVNVKLLEYMGQNITVFEDGWAGTYTDEEGNTLTLDGYSGTIGSAVWTSEDGTEKIEGMYTFDYSPLGDILRLQDANGEVTSYRISIDETFSELGDGSYKEYILYNTQLGYALLMLGENNTATVYTNVAESDEKYDGTVTEVKDKKDLMLFTSDDKQMVFEFKLYSGNKFLGESCISDYFSEGDQIYCHYFTYYPVVEKGAEGVSFLESEDGEELLLAPSIGVAVYTSGDTSTVGWYQFFTDVPGHTYIEINDYGEDEYLFFEYFAGEGETASSFATLGELTDIYYWYNPYSNIADNAAMLILFDGEEKTALYYEYNEDDQLYYYAPGTFTYDGNTGRGKFTSPGGSVSFALDTDDFGYKVFLDRNQQFEEDDITFEGEPPLILDAYGYAKYQDKEGKRLEGKYYFVETDPLHDKVYRIYAIFFVDETSGYEGYFDIDLEHKTYTLCDDAIGSFFEDTTREENLEFDGCGNVVYENIDNETIEGTYTVIGYDDYGRLEVSVTIGNETYRVRCYYMVDSEGRYIGHYTKEVGSAGTYVSDKWQYLTIGTFGDAVYTDQYGVSYEGAVTQFTEHIVSFQGAETDVYCVFGADNTFTVPESGWVIDGDTLVKYLGGMGDEIKIPDGIKKIAPLAFSEQIYGSAYLGADITSLDLNEVEEIGDNAFNGCWFLVSVKGAKLKKVGNSAFYDCIALSSLDLPALEEIGEMAFWLCESLTKVELKAVKTVYAAAFSRCYELSEISLPAVEELYEGVFFDCYALKLVTLGEHLEQIGTPEEVVAGVFQREGSLEQSPLKVLLGCTSVPKVGYDLFTGVTSYTVIVPDIATVKAFYLDEGWAAYNAYVGCESAYDGTYARVASGIFAVLNLNGIATYDSKNESKILGAYEVGEDKMLTIYTFDPEAENNYTTSVRGEFYDSGIKFDADNYGVGFKDYWDPYFGPDKEYALDEYNDSGETLSFKLAGDLSAIPATFVDADGAAKEVTLICARDGDGVMVFYFDVERTRYELSLVGNPAAWFEYTKSFIPIVTAYEAADGSVLILSQEDEEGTKFTAHAILAGLPGIQEFRLEDMIPVWTDENTFTYNCERDDVSYHFTFVLGDGTFSYTYTADNMTTFTSEDGSLRLVVTQNADGGIVSMVLSKNTSSDPENATWLSYSDSFFVSAAGGGYYYYVCDGSDYARFKITLTLEGKEVTGFTAVKSGKAFRAYSAGMYAFLYFDENGEYDNYALYLRDDHVIVAHTTGATVEGNLLTVVVEGGNYANTYYITFDVELEDATLVPANEVYESDEYSDLEGTVRVVKNSDGTTKSMTLTMGDKSYTTFTEYDYYYIFTNGTDYYYVTLSSNSCRISALSAKAFTSGEFTVTLLVQSNNEVAGVVSATYQNKAVVVTFEKKFIGGKDCALLSFTVGDVTKNYLANITDATMNELVEKTLTTTDGKYRITLLMNGNDSVYEVIKLEQKDGDGFKEITISWSEAVEGDDYNYYIQDENYTYYYFNIVKVGNDWTATSVVSE